MFPTYSYKQANIFKVFEGQKLLLRLEGTKAAVQKQLCLGWDLLCFWKMSWLAFCVPISHTWVEPGDRLCCPFLEAHGWCRGKNLPANAGYTRDTGSIPGLWRPPGEGNGNSLQHSCLQHAMDEPGGLLYMKLQRAEHYWTHTHIFTDKNCQE